VTITAVASAITDSPRDSSSPSPCGPNAVCKQWQGAGFCICLQGYFGDPYRSCQPECILNTDCPCDKACVNNKCHNLCWVTCGINADCQVVNHCPSYSCLPSYSGNPFIACHVVQPSKICFFLSLTNKQKGQERRAGVNGVKGLMLNSQWALHQYFDAG
jgi:hypothetical protein